MGPEYFKHYTGVKINFKICCLIAAFSVFMPGCRKSPFDYRSQYTGTYQFLVSEKISIPGVSYTDTAFYYSGSIETGQGTKSILLNFLENTSIETELHEDGSFEKCDCPYNVYGYISYDKNLTGDFYSGKKVKMLYEYTDSTAIFSYYILGEKTE